MDPGLYLYVNPLSAKMVKQTQTTRRQFPDELFVSDHFVKLTLKGLKRVQSLGKQPYIKTSWDACHNLNMKSTCKGWVIQKSNWHFDEQKLEPLEGYPSILSNNSRYSHGRTCALLKKINEIQGWLLLTVFTYLHNQLSSFNCIIVDVWKTWFIKYIVKMNGCFFQ